MLDVFNWSNRVVFGAQHVTVKAAVDMSWDHLAGLTGGAVFGFVLDGENATLRVNDRPFSLPSGAYFVVNAGTAKLSTPGGRILLILAPGADFPFQIGGPIEARGRMRYIDGCTDSLIIPPWRRGEACLNLLHIPPGIEQTMHTHPSDRIGVVVDGAGQCVTPEGITDLRPGMIWRIPADGLHRFRTEGDSLRIVAYHPTSDYGPTDEDHPMVMQTMVGGVSASLIDSIRTKS